MLGDINSGPLANTPTANGAQKQEIIMKGL